MVFRVPCLLLNWFLWVLLLFATQIQFLRLVFLFLCNTHSLTNEPATGQGLFKFSRTGSFPLLVFYLNSFKVINSGEEAFVYTNDLTIRREHDTGFGQTGLRVSSTCPANQWSDGKSSAHSCQIKIIVACSKFDYNFIIKNSQRHLLTCSFKKEANWKKVSLFLSFKEKFQTPWQIWLSVSNYGSNPGYSNAFVLLSSTSGLQLILHTLSLPFISA